MKRQWIITIVIVAIAGLWAVKKYSGKQSEDKKVTFAEVKGSSYWTCPMHPQIHLDHSGECPICHMKLVQVKAQTAQAQETSRADVQPSSGQLNLIGVQKAQVERMDLKLSIPISGRLLSSSSVAFQVYESDLRFMKNGLPFKGQGSDGEISGTISSVDSIVDPTSRTVRVVGRVDKGPRGLVAETTFSGIVEIKLKDRVSVPESSVLHTGTGDIVYIFSAGNKLSARKIMLGAKSEGFYEVTSGLEPGEFISSGPNFLIDSEAKIRGTSNSPDGSVKKPSCAGGEHWDTPMAMCMPGKE
jgi:hypothetical protein